MISTSLQTLCYSSVEYVVDQHMGEQKMKNKGKQKTAGIYFKKFPYLILFTIKKENRNNR